jgi:hypothetical protein
MAEVVIKKRQNSLLKPLGTFLRRFHLLIFFIFTVGCVAGVVLLINQVLTNNADGDDYTSTINAGTIDQSSLERIQSLHTSDQPAPSPELPAGRVNPFAE